jgi:hypothetical protein
VPATSAVVGAAVVVVLVVVVLVVVVLVIGVVVLVGAAVAEEMVGVEDGVVSAHPDAATPRQTTRTIDRCRTAPG